MSRPKLRRPKSLRFPQLLLASALLAALSACGNEDPSAATDGALPPSQETAPPAAVEHESGTLSFALRLEGDLSVNTFTYAITGPAFSKADAIDVSNSTTVSARIDGIPAASGYSLTLSGTSVSTPKAQCSGSAAFDIQAGAVTNLPVAISCHLATTVVEIPAPAPLPRFSIWLSGLALLALGSKLASSRPRPKTVF